MKKQTLIFLITLIISSVAFSQGVDDSKIPLSLAYTPKGLTFSALDTDFSASLYGFMQTDAMKFAQNNQDLSSGVNIRRARLCLDGQLTAAWGYNLWYDLRASDLLLA